MNKEIKTIILEKSGYKIIAEAPLLYKYDPEQFESTYKLFNMRVEDSKGNIITPIIEEAEIYYAFEVSSKLRTYSGFAIIDGAVYYETRTSHFEDSFTFYKIVSGVNTICEDIQQLNIHLKECKIDTFVDNQLISNYILDLICILNKKKTPNLDCFSFEGDKIIIRPRQ